MFLVDTNIFLETLLDQDKKDLCKQFLEKNLENLVLSDFSLHSIGVILFRYQRNELFTKFVEDVLPNVTLLSLPPEQYESIAATNEKLKLDFDDAYQYILAKYYGLEIVTMDSDFRSIEDVDVLFL